MRIKPEIKAKIYAILASQGGSIAVIDNFEETPIIMFIDNYTEPTPNQSVGGIYSASFMGYDLAPVFLTGGQEFSKDWEKAFKAVIEAGLKIRYRISCNQQYCLISLP